MSNLTKYPKYLFAITRIQAQFNLNPNRNYSLGISRMSNVMCFRSSIIQNVSAKCELHSISFKNISAISNICFSKRKINLSHKELCSTKEKPFTEEPSEETSHADQDNLEKELNEKIEHLSKEVGELKDKYQRTLADRENLRQRLEKQIRDSKLFGIQSFCKDLLEVTDVFRKAIESVPEEKVNNADPMFVSLYDGVVMTENQLINVFRRHGCEKIIPKEGDKFDPGQQEAMFEVPVSEGKVPGTIAHVIRTGWKLHDRCVRSAQVGVVKI